LLQNALQRCPPRCPFFYSLQIHWLSRLQVFGLVSIVAAQSSSSVPAAQVTHVVTVHNNASATNGTSVFVPVSYFLSP
jgi:hypothetical protein